MPEEQRRAPDLVVIVSASLESNALGRALTLAKLVPEGSDVEIWGPHTNTMWAQRSGDEIYGYRRTEAKRRVGRLNQLHTNGRSVVMWVSKAFPFAVDLTEGLNPSVPVIVDFDDHDIALAQEFREQGIRHTFILNRWRSGSPERLAVSQASMLRRAHAVTTSSYALSEKLGIDREVLRVPHARPDLRSSMRCRRERPTIGFLGTMRAHKGLTEIRQALEMSSELRCVTFTQSGLSDDGRGQWEFLDPRTPLHFAYGLIDAAVLPMSSSVGSRYQLPAKAIDAAAAGVPIIATETPVLTEYFGDLLLRVENWDELGQKMAVWKSDGSLESYGRSIHQVWERSLSETHVRQVVNNLFDSLIAAR